MAVPPNTDAAFLREVDEELRRDELSRAWKRYGIAAIGVVLLAILGFGGWQVWQAHQQSVAGEQGQQLTRAYEDLAATHPDAAQAKLATLAGSGAAGYRALALMAEGDILLQKKNTAAAAKFGQIVSDTSIGQPFRDLALIRQTIIEFDTLKPDVVIARLRGIAARGNPWFGSAGELVAISYLRMGRRDLAGKLFSQIAQDPDTTETMRQRAVQMAGILGVDAVNDAKEQKSQ